MISLSFTDTTFYLGGRLKNSYKGIQSKRWTEDSSLFKSSIHRNVLSEVSWSADSPKIGKLWRVLQRILDGEGEGEREGGRGVNGCPSPHSCPQSGLNTVEKNRTKETFENTRWGKEGRGC